MTRKSWLLFGVALAAIGSIGTGASAQSASGQNPSRTDQATDVEDVVVTARRRAERAVDVPGNISVIDAEAVRERGGARTTGELLAGQPGVRFLETNSAGSNEISIRGSSTARGSSAEGAVGIYRNGAYIGGGLGGRNFQRFDYFDIGRVEILRGTQGALFGRNAVGGVVNIVSAQPVFENMGWASVRYTAENQNTDAQAVANIALNDSWAFRIGAEVVDQGDGFFYNSFNDVHHDTTKGAGVRAQVRRVSDGSDVNLMVEHQDFNIPAISYQLAIAPQTAFPFGYVTPRDETYWNRAPVARQNVTSVTLNVKQDMGWAELESTTMFRGRQTALQFDLDGLNSALLTQLRATGVAPNTREPDSSNFSRDQSDVFVQDIRLSGDALSGRLNWLAGAEYYSLTSDGSVVLTRTPTPSLFIPAPANPSPGTLSPTTITVESSAAYGSAEFAVTDRFKISAEGRYTSDDRTFISRRFDLATGVAVGGAGFIVDGASSPDNFSYNLIASYRPLERTLLYIKHGTSFRAGNFNPNLGDPRQPNPITAAYENELSATSEVGIRSAMANGTGFILAAYFTEITDQIVSRENGCSATNPACPVLATNFLTNAGDGETKGIELEGFGRMNLAGTLLRWRTSWSWQDGEAVSGPFKGEALPGIPQFLAGADLNLRRPLANGTAVFGSLAYSAQWGGVQELYTPGVATNRFTLDDYAIVNLRAGVEMGRYQVSVFANNAFDERYRVLVSSTIARWNQPRTTGIELRANF
jgi:iron complex outermembrane receptor protein